MNIFTTSAIYRFVLTKTQPGKTKEPSGYSITNCYSRTVDIHVAGNPNPAQQVLT